jgi:regulator of protease activity HflC (stomatin/prohibitin superfamily)
MQVLEINGPLQFTGERQANINIADGKKSSVILQSEAAKMDQINRAQGYLSLQCILMPTI